MSTDSPALPEERLHQGRLLLPQEIDEELLARFFVLSDPDKAEVELCRGIDNKLGFALALSWFRMTGRFPTSYEVIPLRAVNDLARQLGLDPVLVLAYPGRKATKHEHEERLRTYLKVRPFDEAAERALATWAMERALEGESDADLLPRAEDLLRRRGVELPGITVVDRLVRQALLRASEECVGRVLRGLAPAEETALWELLEPALETNRRSGLARFKTYRARASAPGLRELLGRVRGLRELGVEKIDLGGIAPAAIERLARIVEDHTPSFLRRMGRDRAVAYAACFASETYSRTIDATLSGVDRILTEMRTDARQDWLERLRERSQEEDEAARLLAEVVGALLASTGSADAAWRAELARHSRERLEKAVALSVGPRPGAPDLEEELCRRYPHLRKFTPELVSVLEFGALAEGERILEAIRHLREMNAEPKKKTVADGPIAFADAKWRKKIVRPDGGWDRRAWETALWFTFQKALRAGHVTVRGSREYRPIVESIYGAQTWEAERRVRMDGLNLPADPREHIAAVVSRFTEIGGELDRDFLENLHARFEKGRLIVSKDAGETPPSRLRSLQEMIQDEMPQMDLDQCLMEAARRVPFLRHLRPATGNEPRTPDLDRKLLVCLFGLGCNVDLGRLARSTGVPRHTLSDLVGRYFRAENLIDANAELVNYHHGLSISRVWGTGEMCGADGKRYEARGRSLLAGFLPRYFGHLGRGFTIYRHTSDQYSVFSTQAISCLVRESMHMLDGLVENRTVVRPGRATTDTHGATHAVFWLSAFLGYDFCPRIANLGRRRFFRPKGVGPFRNIEPLFERAPLDLEIIVEHWDWMARVAASVQDRKVPASVVLRQIENAPDHDPRATAVKTLGTIYETMSLMRYLQHPALRREVRRQLNRCEAENDLSSFVNFGERGIFRCGDLNYVVDKAQCQSLVMNAIVVVNTVLLEAVVGRLKSRGIEVPEDVLAHLSPLMRRHINPYGQYRFEAPQMEGTP